MSDRQVSEWKVHDHGQNGESYFPGHGLYGSKFEDCATGIGNTPREALTDALDQLAQNGWAITEGQELEMMGEIGAARLTQPLDSDVAGNPEWHFYVSVDVK